MSITRRRYTVRRGVIAVCPNRCSHAELFILLFLFISCAHHAPRVYRGGHSEPPAPRHIIDKYLPLRHPTLTSVNRNSTVIVKVTYAQRAVGLLPIRLRSRSRSVIPAHFACVIRRARNKPGPGNKLPGPSEIRQNKIRQKLTIQKNTDR